MSEVSVAVLEPCLREQAASAQAALNRGRTELALELCVAVLSAQPGCLAVRRLERAARLKHFATRRDTVSQLVTAVSSAPLLLDANVQLREDPRAALLTAERLLRRDPQNLAALCLLGQAATALGWKETAIFAHETASDLAPERPDLWLSLGVAYLAAGRAKDAISAAEEALRLHPADGEAQTVLRNATVSLGIAQGKWDRGRDQLGRLDDRTKTAG